MPGAKGEGRPTTREFMKLGRVVITRPDQLNWAVDDGTKTTYHTSLPTAIRKAVEVAAESRSHDAREWLAEYEKIERRLHGTIAKALDEYGECDCR